jgi:hypothetical protein
MNRQQKWIKIFFAVSFLLFLSVSPAYLHYINCVETDFPSSKARFESPDQDYLLADQQDKFEILRPSVITAIAETALSGKFLFLSFKESLYNQETLILRC